MILTQIEHERGVLKNRALPFDLMRAIAILVILIYHLPGYSFDFFDLQEFGIGIDSAVLRELSKYFGLALFVFVSGHLANLKVRNFPDLPATKEYILGKIIRIFPLYYLALLAFCNIYEIRDPLQLIVHVSGLQLILASQLVKPLPTLWFIGLILIYYAAYIFFRAEKLNIAVKIAALSSFPIIILIVNRVFHVMDLRIVLYYGVFLLGLYSGRSDFFKRISWVQTILSTLAFMTILMVYGDYTFATKPFSSLTSFIIVNLLMFLFIDFTYKSCHYLADKIRVRRFFEIVSYSSFCMFLFHRPVWSYMLKALDKTPIIDNRLITATILAVIGIPLIIVISYSIQYFYDRIVLTRKVTPYRAAMAEEHS